MSAPWPPFVDPFLERQLGAGETPGWSWVPGMPESISWSGAPKDRVRRLKIHVAETLTDWARALGKDDVFFRGDPVAEIVWQQDPDAILSWRSLPAARERGSLHLDPDGLVQALRAAVDVPQIGATEPQVRPARKLTLHLSEVSWGRTAAGLDVHGDHFSAIVNATTGRLVTYQRGPWLPLPVFPVPSMTEQEAQQLVDRRLSAMASGIEIDYRSQRILLDETSGLYHRVWTFWCTVDGSGETPAIAPPPLPVGEEAVETAIGLEEPVRDPQPPGPPRRSVVVHVREDGQVRVD